MKKIFIISTLILASFQATIAQINASTTISNFNFTWNLINNKTYKTHDRCFYRIDSSASINNSIVAYHDFYEINGANSTASKVATAEFTPGFLPMFSSFLKNSTNNQYMYLAYNTFKAMIFSGSGPNLSLVDSFYINLGFANAMFAESGANFYLAGNDSLYLYDFSSFQFKAKLPAMAKAITSNGISAYITCSKDLGSNSYVHYVCKYNNATLSIIDSIQTNTAIYGSLYDYSFPKENVKDIVIGFGNKLYYIDDQDVITNLSFSQGALRQYGTINNKLIFAGRTTSGLYAMDLASKIIDSIGITTWIPSREVENNGTYMYIPDYDSTITITQGTAATSLKGKLPTGNTFSTVMNNYGLCGNDYVTCAVSFNPAATKYAAIKSDGTGYVFDNIPSDGSNLSPVGMLSNAQGLYSIHKQSGNFFSKLVQLNPCAGSTSITEIENSTRFSIYPNPTDSKINFETKQTGSYIVITNPLSQIVLKQKIQNHLTTIETNSWTPGIYFATYGNSTQRILKR